MNANSWWANQRPYVDKAVNHIVTNNHPPVFSVCPAPDIKNEHNYFTATDTVFLMLYYRFLTAGDITQYTIYRPDNSVWGNWSYTHNGPDYNAAWFYYWMIAGSGEQTGTWRYEVEYDNQTYSTNFYLGLTGIENQTEEISPVVYYDGNTQQIQLQWQNTGTNWPAGEYRIVFYDLTGREIMNEALLSSTNRFSSEKFAKGIYTYSILKNGSLQHAGKLIVAE